MKLMGPVYCYLCFSKQSNPFPITFDKYSIFKNIEITILGYNKRYAQGIPEILLKRTACVQAA